MSFPQHSQRETPRGTSSGVQQRPAKLACRSRLLGRHTSLQCMLPPALTPALVDCSETGPEVPHQATVPAPHPREIDVHASVIAELNSLRAFASFCTRDEL